MKYISYYGDVHLASWFAGPYKNQGSRLRVKYSGNLLYFNLVDGKWVNVLYEDILEPWAMINTTSPNVRILDFIQEFDEL